MDEFDVDAILAEMEEDKDWWKSCVKCYYCPMFTKDCPFKKSSIQGKYFCTCSKGK